MNIGIFRNTARAGIFVRVQRNGVRIPDAERHCKVYVLSDWRRCAGHSRERGRLCGKKGLLPAH